MAKQILFTFLGILCEKLIGCTTKNTKQTQSFTKGKKFKPTDIFTDKVKKMYQQKEIK